MKNCNLIRQKVKILNSYVLILYYIYKYELKINKMKYF